MADKMTPVVRRRQRRSRVDEQSVLRHGTRSTTMDTAAGTSISTTTRQAPMTAKATVTHRASLQVFVSVQAS